MTEALVKLAPILTVDRMNSPGWMRDGRDVYWDGSLKLAPMRDGVPVFVDHRADRQIGVVRELGRMQWTDGPWIAASVSLTDPPDWLKTGTPVSFGRYNVHAELAGRDAQRVSSALVSEVSLLHGLAPAEPLAQVLVLSESPGITPRKTGAGTPGRSATSSVVTTVSLSQDTLSLPRTTRQTICDEIERVLGVTLGPDDDIEAIVQACRTRLGLETLQRVYDAHVAVR